MWYLSLRQLTKRYGQTLAVDDVSLEIFRGEFVTLLGPSGCGKTTTLRLIAGFVRPDKGEIAVGDRVLVSTQRGVFVPPSKRGMGMVFQSYAVWPHMQVFDNIAYGLRIKKLAKSEIRKKVREALELVRLEGFERRYPPQLSGGEQQRVALARALVTQPDILLFDEPLSNLDAKLREEMRFEIREIQRKIRITAVYVTHDQAEAMVMSDRTAVMSKGRIHQVGHPYEVYTSPRDQFVAGFIGLTNFLKGTVREKDENYASVLVSSNLLFRARRKREIETGQDVLLSVRPENISMLEGQQSGDNVIAGKLARVDYLGSVMDCRVDVNGLSLRVQTRPRSVEPGDKIYLRIDPDQFSIIET